MKKMMKKMMNELAASLAKRLRLHSLFQTLPAINNVSYSPKNNQWKQDLASLGALLGVRSFHILLVSLAFRHVASLLSRLLALAHNLAASLRDLVFCL